MMPVRGYTRLSVLQGDEPAALSGRAPAMIRS